MSVRSTAIALAALVVATPSCVLPERPELVYAFPPGAEQLAAEERATWVLAPDQSFVDIGREDFDRYFFVPCEGVEAGSVKLGIHAIDGEARPYKLPLTLAPGSYRLRMFVEILNLRTIRVLVGDVPMNMTVTGDGWELDDVALNVVAGKRYAVRTRASSPTDSGTDIELWFEEL